MKHSREGPVYLTDKNFIIKTKENFIMNRCKGIKRVISIVLVLITVMSTFAISASAASTTAFDILSSSKYAKTYTLSNSGKTIPYTSKYLNTRGTQTYGASSSSYIANSTDELYILDVGCTNGKYWAYVSYPTSTRRVNAYIYLSAITKNNGSHVKTESSGKFYCSIRENQSNSSSYYVAKNDTVYLVATSTSKYQILYPTSGGMWRLAWCNKTDYQKYCSGSSTNTSGTIKLNVPLYKQNDSRWKNVYIGTKTIGAIGCTTTCIAMVYSYNTGKVVYPNEVMQKLRYSNNDLYWSSISNVGLTSQAYNCSMSNSIMSTIYSKLKAGKPVIIGASTSSGDSQHWVVITGYTGSSTTSYSTSNFIVNDPGSRDYSTLQAFLANGSGTDRTRIIRIMY